MRGKCGDEGFTLMEALGSTAIMLIMAGCLSTALAAALASLERALIRVRAAREITETSRLIRVRAEEMHIPYWDNGALAAAQFEEALMRAPHVSEVRLLSDGAGRVRGAELCFEIRGLRLTREVLFPSVPVLGAEP